ncbi:MAG TPA: metallophosphoesterase [Methylomirabilota bacterium]|nr:metallophosphoesterase [Methylomirabilota bacterium]
MFRLVHLSDPHLGPLPAASVRELASKRVLGYINWHRNRAVVMHGDLVLRLAEAVKETEPDHIVVTGDLVNIALPAELEPARVFLETLGEGPDVTVVPGNHDAYVPGALVRATNIWRSYMIGDHDHHGAPTWPTLRQRGNVALVGVSTARASAPFMATGYVSVPQTTVLGEMLTATGHDGLFRVVLIHHPPIRGSTDWHKRLIGGSRVRSALKKHGAELVLHGHTHLATKMSLEGKQGMVPVIGVPSASQQPGGSMPGAGFNVFDIAPRKNGWTLNLTEHRVVKPGGPFEVVGESVYELAAAAKAETES